MSAENPFPEGVSIVSPPPEKLDFDTAPEALFTIAVAAAAEAEQGTLDTLDVVFDPPAGSVSSRLTASRFVVEVVAADAPVGPIAISDFVGVPADGSSFDPTVNDVAGDAAIDPSSLRVVEAPGSGGTLTVTSSGEFTYVPRGSSGESAVYEICDLNSICTTATLDLWNDA